jgi:hypothetical protein
VLKNPFNINELIQGTTEFTSSNKTKTCHFSASYKMYIDSTEIKLSILLLVTLILNINGNNLQQFENEAANTNGDMAIDKSGRREHERDSKEILNLIKLMSLIKMERQMQTQASANSQDEPLSQTARRMINNDDDDGPWKGLFKGVEVADDNEDNDENTEVDNDERQYSDKNQKLNYAESKLLKKLLTTNKRSFDRKKSVIA